MKSSAFQALTTISKPKSIVFCDFDSTYFKHAKIEITDYQAYIGFFEGFLQQYCQQQQALFGFVSGAPFSYILSHLESQSYGLFPHFAASAYGSEIHYYTAQANGAPVLTLDQDWDHSLPEPQTIKRSAEQIKTDLEAAGFAIKPQGQAQQSTYKTSLVIYCPPPQRLDDLKALLTQHCNRHQLKFNLSQVNSENDDYQAYHLNQSSDKINTQYLYDLDFYPASCSKKATVEYLCQKFNVPLNQTLAFGDSGNDLEMLNTVNQGYLVANATTEAKAKFSKNPVLSEPYLKGVYQGLS